MGIWGLRAIAESHFAAESPHQQALGWLAPSPRSTLGGDSPHTLGKLRRKEGQTEKPTHQTNSNIYPAQSGWINVAVAVCRVRLFPFGEKIDVAIIGGGPAGMQAALVLARTRKKVVVFDAPVPPRNAASHGFHNFLGLDGMLPAEIRKQAWQQIDVYQHAELRHEWVTDVDYGENGENGGFIITAAESGQVMAKKVILTLGYHDVHPDIDGFAEAWAKTIIPCPFCDGYENRDRIWGIVANYAFEATGFAKMAQNWTKQIKIILNSADIKLDPAFEQEMADMGIPIHHGPITAIEQADGKVQAITLDTGEEVKVETLLWSPPEEQSPLVKKLIGRFDLALNEMGYLKTDESQETNVKGLYAAGDVEGWSGGIEAATAGSMAGFMIAHGWYE